MREPTVPAQGIRCVTDEYRAPELSQRLSVKQVDSRVDMYARGVIAEIVKKPWKKDHSACSMQLWKLAHLS